MTFFNTITRWKWNARALGFDFQVMPDFFYFYSILHQAHYGSYLFLEKIPIFEKIDSWHTYLKDAICLNTSNTTKQKCNLSYVDENIFRYQQSYAQAIYQRIIFPSNQLNKSPPTWLQFYSSPRNVTVDSYAGRCSRLIYSGNPLAALGYLNSL